MKEVSTNQGLKGCSLGALRIIGIDPGSRKTGVGIIDSQGNRMRHVFHTVITPRDELPAARLYYLFAELKAVIAAYAPHAAAIEDVFVAKNASSALKLGQARGALIAACGDAGLMPASYSPTCVKQSMTGYGRADKAQMQQMVKMLLQPPLPLAEDAADALAVSVCHAHHFSTADRLR